MTFTKELYMQRNRLQLMALLATFAIGDAVAQAPAAPRPQQAPTTNFGPPQQPVPQPIYIVPAPQTQAPPAGPRINPELATVELAPLLQRVERESRKRFLVDGRVGPQIYLGGVEPNDVTYPVLLAILRANGYAAFESEGYVNVVPDANIRFHAPVVQTDDASIPADLYVTRMLKTTNVNSAMLVPILRPLLPQQAHLSAHLDTSQLIIMDRYANVQRITEIVKALDVPARQ